MVDLRTTIALSGGFWPQTGTRGRSKEDVRILA